MVNTLIFQASSNTRLHSQVITDTIAFTQHSVLKNYYLNENDIGKKSTFDKYNRETSVFKIWKCEQKNMISLVLKETSESDMHSLSTSDSTLCITHF